MHHWLANSADYCEKQNVLTQYYCQFHSEEIESKFMIVFLPPSWL